MAIDKVVSASITDSSVTDAKLSFNSNQFRNIIINGDMSIAQRSTSVSSITSSDYYTIDRMRTRCNIGTWTQSQSTDVPSGQGFANSLKMDCTTANASPPAANTLSIQHIIEGQNLQYLKKGTSAAESLTMSFWVKSSKTGTYIAELFDNDNQRQISKSYTIDSADTWEKKTITYEGDTSGAFGNDNGASLYIEFWLAAGSNYTSGTLSTTWTANTNANRVVGNVNLADSTSNEWYVTGVQLEAGTSASDFEFLPVDVNLQRCQRYFYKSYEIGTAVPTATFNSCLGRFLSSSNAAYASIQLPTVRLRASPTTTIYNPSSNATASIRSDSTDHPAAVAHVNSNGGGWVYSNGSTVNGNTSTRIHFTFEAEL
jgi:hypothetical protein